MNAISLWYMPIYKMKRKKHEHSVRVSNTQFRFSNFMTSFMISGIDIATWLCFIILSFSFVEKRLKNRSTTVKKTYNLYSVRVFLFIFIFILTFFVILFSVFVLNDHFKTFFFLNLLFNCIAFCFHHKQSADRHIMYSIKNYDAFLRIWSQSLAL